ncbi:MAG: glycosyltransferase family 1 protein [Patescibacteria group bacterium]|nr:glycosyltransferase family 4 protein [Patescibacteria group bacterium]
MKTFGIDINALAREQITGTERYVASVLDEMMKIQLLDNERVVLYASRQVFNDISLPSGWEVKILKWPFKKGWTHIRLSLELFLRTPYVFFSPAHEIPFLTGRTKIVFTVHDIAFHLLPNIYSAKDGRRQEWSVKRAIEKATKLITVSETTKHDLVEHYGVDEARIVATPLAIFPDKFRVSDEEKWRVKEKYHLGEKAFVLSVGRIEKKKNISMLIRACKKAGQECLLAGSFGFGEEKIKEQIADSHGLVETLGYVPDKDLPGLVANAFAYVFPSHYEGFGIPALEAMAAGVPLIASDIPALREVAGDAALFAQPNREDEWVEALMKIRRNEDLRNTLIEKGYERISHFSWPKTAEQTWHILRSV